MDILPALSNKFTIVFLDRFLKLSVFIITLNLVSYTTHVLLSSLKLTLENKSIYKVTKMFKISLYNREQIF